MSYFSGHLLYDNDFWNHTRAQKERNIVNELQQLKALFCLPA